MWMSAESPLARNGQEKLNLSVPQPTGNLFITWAAISFWRRIRSYGFSYL